MTRARLGSDGPGADDYWSRAALLGRPPGRQRDRRPTGTKLVEEDDVSELYVQMKLAVLDGEAEDAIEAVATAKGLLGVG